MQTRMRVRVMGRADEGEVSVNASTSTPFEDIISIVYVCGTI